MGWTSLREYDISETLSGPDPDDHSRCGDLGALCIVISEPPGSIVCNVDIEFPCGRMIRIGEHRGRVYDEEIAAWHKMLLESETRSPDYCPHTDKTPPEIVDGHDIPTSVCLACGDVVPA